jgi:hypothetical protein
VTIERLAILLQGRPQGMLVTLDELAGLFLNLSRYSGGTDGAQAKAFYWTERDLLGLHPAPDQPAANYSPLARLDDLGLIWLLRGRPVITLTKTGAIMSCPSGARLTYRRRIEPWSSTDIVSDLEKPATEVMTPVLAETAETKSCLVGGGALARGQSALGAQLGIMEQAVAYSTTMPVPGEAAEITETVA